MINTACVISYNDAIVYLSRFEESIFQHINVLLGFVFVVFYVFFSVVSAHTCRGDRGPSPLGLRQPILNFTQTGVHVNLFMIYVGVIHNT